MSTDMHKKGEDDDDDDDDDVPVMITRQIMTKHAT